MSKGGKEDNNGIPAKTYTNLLKTDTYALPLL